MGNKCDSLNYKHKITHRQIDMPLKSICQWAELIISSPNLEYNNKSKIIWLLNFILYYKNTLYTPYKLIDLR